MNVNEYDRKYFRYNSTVTTPRYGRTQDDGQFLGLSMVKTKFGWRKTPYVSKQKFNLKIAPFGNGAVRFKYLGNFPNKFGKVDLSPQALLLIPEFENWFGLGNETTNPFVEREFHWVRMRSLELSPLIEFNGNNLGKVSFKIGPTYQLVNITNSLTRVSNDEVLGLDEADLTTNHFIGGLAIFNLGFEDNSLVPSNGLNFNGEFRYLNNFSQNENLFQMDLSTDFYISLAKNPQLVFAHVLGYRKVFGDPQFHQYPDLGNDTNLRGFRDERFRGESAIYHNMDLRLHLFNWNNRVLPLGINIYGGFDYGRVYFEPEESNTWHYSTTLGLSFNVLGAFLVNPTYSFTEEGNSFNFRFGYNF